MVTLAERFARNTCPEPNSGCLLWTGTLSVGYGKMSVGAVMRQATHIAFFLEETPGEGSLAGFVLGLSEAKRLGVAAVVAQLCPACRGMFDYAVAVANAAASRAPS